MYLHVVIQSTGCAQPVVANTVNTQAGHLLHPTLEEGQCVLMRAALSVGHCTVSHGP